MFHFRYNVPDWPEATDQLPMHYAIKAVDNVQMLAEAKARNSGLVRILRHYTDNQVPGNSYAESVGIARDFFKTFIDGTFLNGSTMGVPHNTTEYIEEWNEYAWFASQSESEKARWADWALACLDVWYDELRPTYNLDTNLMVAAIPIGNNIDFRVAERVHELTDVENGVIPRIGYHAYWPTQNGVVPDPDDEWKWYSGRWAAMDATLRNQGWVVHWGLTEAGPIGYSGEYPDISLGDQAGWRSDEVCGGNIDKYLPTLANFMDRWAAWNAANGYRCLTPNLFDSGYTDTWKKFRLLQPELNTIAAFVAGEQRWRTKPPEDIVPPDPPPTEVEDYVRVDVGAANFRTSPWYSGAADNKVLSLVRDSVVQRIGFAEGEVYQGSAIWVKVRLPVVYANGATTAEAYVHEDLVAEVV